MEENAGGDELLWWATTQGPLCRVNRNVIEKRCARVTAVYSVHSQFICRFSWCFCRKADSAHCAPEHYQQLDWTSGAAWPSSLFPSWLRSLSGPRTLPLKSLHPESFVLLTVHPPTLWFLIHFSFFFWNVKKYAKVGRKCQRKTYYSQVSAYINKSR